MNVVSVLKTIFEYIGLCLIIIFAPIPIFFAAVYRSIELILKYRWFKNIADQVAVVTGGGHGLGRCIALQLASRGCHVAIADINLNGAEETVSLIKSQYKVKCKAYKVDVTNLEQVSNLNEKITADLGIATILINNAGIILLSNYVNTKIEEIQRMVNVNLMAHFVTNSVFLENMKSQRKGHIVAICSAVGMVPIIYNEAYCASKSAVYGMMRALRLRLKLHDYGDIRTTTICPSFLATNPDVVDVAKKVSLHKEVNITKGEDAARIVVHAMLRNEVEVFIPRSLNILIRILHLFPAPCQDTIAWILTPLVCKNYANLLSK